MPGLCWLFFQLMTRRGSCLATPVLSSLLEGSSSFLQEKTNVLVLCYLSEFSPWLKNNPSFAIKCPLLEVPAERFLLNPHSWGRQHRPLVYASPRSLMDAMSINMLSVCLSPWRRALCIFCLQLCSQPAEQYLAHSRSLLYVCCEWINASSAVTSLNRWVQGWEPEEFPLRPPSW